MSVRLNTAFAVAAAAALILTGCSAGAANTESDGGKSGNGPSASSEPTVEKTLAPELSDAELDALADAEFGTFDTLALIDFGNAPASYAPPAAAGIVKLSYNGGPEYAGGFLGEGGVPAAQSFWLGSDFGAFGTAAAQPVPTGFALTGASDYWTAMFGPVSGLDALPKQGGLTPAVPGHPNIVVGLHGGGGDIEFTPTVGDAFSVSYVADGVKTVALDLAAWDGKEATSVTLPEGINVVTVTATQPWTRS
jgi:hypothetical protein